MASRTPQEVFQHHAEVLIAGDLEGIVSDYADDAVFISPAGVLRGKDGVREAFTKLLGDVPNADWDVPTMCEEASCPNIGECWEAGTATFMILGDVCTRACKYCGVAHGMPVGLDLDEPRRVAESVAAMALEHVVITSVNRDELPDGGAGIYAETIRQIRARSPKCQVEVLIPDFKGDEAALAVVLAAEPTILGHNLETVERIHPDVRPGGRYWRSISFLGASKRLRPDVLTKTGVILGMGEREDEIRQAMVDLREAGVDILTLGQYLRPSAQHIPVARWVTPEEFAEWKRLGEQELGFGHVESGPLVRSSYHAKEQAREVAPGGPGRIDTVMEADVLAPAEMRFGADGSPATEAGSDVSAETRSGRGDAQTGQVGHGGAAGRPLVQIELRKAAHG